MLPFSHEQFLAAFVAYNDAIWPAQVLAYLAGGALCVLLVSDAPGRSAWIAGGLAAMWAWTGVAYHGLFFSRINDLAIAFAALFVLQAALLVVAGSTHRLRFGTEPVETWRLVVGWGLVVYSLQVYPAIGEMTGTIYPAAPMFGVTPCPVTLFTWGVLLLSSAVPWWLLVIPSIWAVVGGSAAFLLQVPQDWPLLATVLCAALVPHARKVRHAF